MSCVANVVVLGQGQAEGKRDFERDRSPRGTGVTQSCDICADVTPALGMVGSSQFGQPYLTKEIAEPLAFVFAQHLHTNGW